MNMARRLMTIAVAALGAAMAVGGCTDPVETADPAGQGTMGDSRQVSGPQTGNGTGKGIYAKACFSCHQAGLVGAPRFGDGAAWAPRMEKGHDLLIDHAVKGFSGNTGVMPAKGGHAYLSDEQVAAAVRYMVDAAR